MTKEGYDKRKKLKKLKLTRQCDGQFLSVPPTCHRPSYSTRKFMQTQMMCYFVSCAYVYELE